MKLVEIFKNIFKVCAGISGIVSAGSFVLALATKFAAPAVYGYADRVLGICMVLFLITTVLYGITGIICESP